MGNPVGSDGPGRARKRTSEGRMRAFLAEHWAATAGVSAAVVLVGMWGYEVSRDCRPQFRPVYYTRKACEADLPGQSCSPAPYARLQQAGPDRAPATVRDPFVGPLAVGGPPPFSAIAAGYERVERGGFGCSYGSSSGFSGG